MQKLADIPYQEAQINLYTNRIWCLVTYHFFSKDQVYQDRISSATNVLASSYTNLMSKFDRISFPLEYN